MRIFKHRDDDIQQRDQHIAAAYELLHKAINELRLASNAAYRMGDEGFSGDLWDYGSEIGGITGQLNDHLTWVAKRYVCSEGCWPE